MVQSKPLPSLNASAVPLVRILNSFGQMIVTKGGRTQNDNYVSKQAPSDPEQALYLQWR